jgi:Spy/CpxP family protein refolding chaperone
MKKLSLIAVLTLGSLLACCSLANAQTSSTNSPDSTPKKGKRGAMFSPEARLDRMSTELSLTDDQKPKVKAVLEDTGKQMQGLRDLEPDERRSKMQSVREDESKKLKDILTPDQYEKYQKMMQDMGKKKKKQSSE